MSLEEEEPAMPKPRLRHGASQNNLVQNGNGHASDVRVNATEDTSHMPTRPRSITGRLSTYTETDAGMDLEDEMAGSARR